MNYFELFGLPIRFKLDPRQLAERHRKLQSTFHPDRFADASAFERRLAVQRAAEINQALHTLKDPVERARYLLSLRGFDVDGDVPQVEQSFLMEQMELREALAEVRDRPDPLSALEELTAHIARRTDAILRELAEQLDEASEASHAAARESIAKLMFLRKIEREANEIHDELLES